MLDVAEENAHREWGVRKSTQHIKSVWSKANTLDPYLHQAIFHFLRGQNLLAQEFEMEAVVAFDCVMQSVKGLLIRAKLATSATNRGELCRMLGIGRQASEIADEGYFIRNNFGAHAGGWRWWDHNELTEEVAPALSAISRQVLQKATKLEEQYRSVHPEPDDWSEWLDEQFEMLWNVVWFDRRRAL